MLSYLLDALTDGFLRNAKPNANFVLCQIIKNIECNKFNVLFGQRFYSFDKFWLFNFLDPTIPVTGKRKVKTGGELCEIFFQKRRLVIITFLKGIF